MKQIAILILCLLATSARAQGIVTFDPTNVVQTTISAQQAVTQTAQQLQQYQAQLQQLQNQLQNTANPSAFVWDHANTTISQVLATLNTVDGYKAQAGSLDAYLSQYSNASQYQGTSCIGTGGCTNAQIQQLNASQYTGSVSQKAANDNMLRNIDAQQQQLRSDASNLVTLQQNAQTATGQMQALQAANQLASNQAAQLLQIRTLLLAQQTAEATRAEAVVDKEARQQAAHDAYVGTAPIASQPYSITGYAGAAP
jgi:P-type conjugative transfer protein TrbJ